jgi:hypothetical protein
MQRIARDFFQPYILSMSAPRLPLTPAGRGGETVLLAYCV